MTNENLVDLIDDIKEQGRLMQEEITSKVYFLDERFCNKIEEIIEKRIAIIISRLPRQVVE